MFSLSISSITFSDGTTVDVGPTDIVVFVGANNAGKSAALAGILQHLSNRVDAHPVIQGLVPRVGDVNELADYCEQTFAKDPNYSSTGPGTRYHAEGGSSPYPEIEYLVTQLRDGNLGLGQATKYFAKLLSTETRLTSMQPPSAIQYFVEPAHHPVHKLGLDADLELSLSNAFREAFGVDLILHRNAGSTLPLLIGERPLPNTKAGEDRLSPSYLKKLHSLSPLTSQGDGMKAFLAVLLHSELSAQSIILIDEPEAFLHPPQARLLGQMLVRRVAKNRQLFVATHSSDFIRGLLDADDTRVRVIRLQREAIALSSTVAKEVNIATELSPAAVQTLWRDPLLRHSNILDGLFHERVVICESDADCRFFSALADATANKRPGKKLPDIMYVHGSGYHRAKMIVEALAAVAVSLRVVPDFDVLRELKFVRAIYTTLGGDWSEVEPDYKITINAIAQSAGIRKPAQVRDEGIKALQIITDEPSLKIARRKLTELFKDASYWNFAKQHGRNSLKGGALSACDRMLEKFASRGLFINPFGELECFCRSLMSDDRHGPAWVNSVLEKDLATDPELDDARKFLTRLLS